MPGFDGTGPRGEGAMTGRGEGYCTIVLPSPKAGGGSYGYSGLQGTPVLSGAPSKFPLRETRFAGISGLAARRGRRHGPWRGSGPRRLFGLW